MADSLADFLERNPHVTRRQSRDPRNLINEKTIAGVLGSTTGEKAEGYFDPRLATAATPGADVTKPVSAEIDISSLPSTTAKIDRTTVRKWMFNGFDAKIELGWCAIRWPSSLITDFLNRRVRGRWLVSVVQQLTDRTFENVTRPIGVTNPSGGQFLLGSTSGRLVEGRPVLLQIEYEAASAQDSEVVFWDSAEWLSVTLTLT